MKSAKNIKLLAVAVLVLIVLVSLLMLSAIYSYTSAEPAEDASPVLVYFYAIINLLLGVFFFVLIIKGLELKEKTKTIYVAETKEEETEDEANVTREEDVEKEEEELKAYFEETRKRVIPKRTTKIKSFTEKLLSNMANELDIVQGLFFIKEDKKDIYTIAGEYAYYSEEKPREFKTGETLSGQVAKNKKMVVVDNIPEGYITILSGLGEGSPTVLAILPLLENDETIGIIELASFKKFDEKNVRLLEFLSTSISEHLIKLKS
jgi:putative methionine-R-sulfoxide reductase with GAF domain